MTHARPKPVVLCILDGWGERDEREHNAIAQANTPNWDRLRAHYLCGRLSASEQDVGLPTGQMGNSEVGHMNIGAGRVVMQDLPRIDAAIADGSLAANAQLQHFIAALQKSGGTAHLLGLLSDGGVHAHQAHIVALANILATAGIPVAIHAFLDGRDTAPQSAAGYVAQVESALHPNARIATVTGRYYAMDRDKRWERVSQAYAAMVQAKGAAVATAQDAIAQSYAGKLSDEFVLPHIVGDYAGMREGDGLLMANFRADRARQMLHALVDPAFSDFPTTPVKYAATLGMVEYSDALNAFLPALFPQQSMEQNLGEIVANAGLTQLRIAETEKYAHVTFFFSGGREAPYAGEERILVPSPKVATYDLQPEMSAPAMTDKLVEAIESGRFDLIVVNYANTDMVGHSGDIRAAMRAVEAVDACLGRVVSAVEKVGGAMLVSADHGNAECMHDDEGGQPHTAHTLNLVPCIIVGEAYMNTGRRLRDGILADIAPTVLGLMGLAQPAAMTGRNLLAEDAAHASVA
ncbi:MAG: 2,3-bisphosphoglycerate-independent phosphoglycerate mutase [Azospirillum brasilense]|nr:MAG: 2,3-bisphosphoglycerate-independent phosphoglycerate mutase [Azospirillum brasilense]